MNSDDTGWTDTSFDFDDEPTQPGFGPIAIGGWYAPAIQYNEGDKLKRKCTKCRAERVVVAKMPDSQEFRAFCKMCGHSEKL